MKSPIKQLIISAALYLPLCFFIWFYGAAFWVMPVRWLTELTLNIWQADLFNGVVQNQYLLVVETLIFPTQAMTGHEGKIAVLDVQVNPMIYGYGLAVIGGLVASLPDLSWQKKMIQIMIGYVMIVLVQSFGSFWQTIKHLLFSGGDAQQAILDTGISPDLVAAMYQLSYLILPAVMPIVLWILMNRKFIEFLVNNKDSETADDEPA
ncbi:exosortase H-associated membrane protein [Marinicella rhabdoformis]|uniref:exosortase H-associated membrane protein n=1 Tax=Marinicella rhabdoformis TaxID=2580566 RepID=UPI0031B56EA6